VAVPVGGCIFGVCAECGHIGCCDSSPSQHGTRHAQDSGHPFVTSLEPDEEWFWNDQPRQFYDGRELAPPTVAPGITIRTGSGWAPSG